MDFNQNLSVSIIAPHIAKISRVHYYFTEIEVQNLNTIISALLKPYGIPHYTVLIIK